MQCSESPPSKEFRAEQHYRHRPRINDQWFPMTGHRILEYPNGSGGDPTAENGLQNIAEAPRRIRPYGGRTPRNCGQGIAASFGPAERKLPPDRTALDVDDAELAAAQLIDDRRHRHDGHGVAVAHETLDALGTAQLHHYTQRSESYIRRREVFRNHFEGSRTAFAQHQGHRLKRFLSL